MTSTSTSTRGRDIHEQHRASTPLELLFDLTFVVAIAQTSVQLHHGVMAHHTGEALFGFVLAFFSIWWAWMNYTWFASAYDNDDAWFRILTMVQMGGVLMLAIGVPGLFTGHFLAAVIGYVVMRLALCAQWLRAALGDPARRKTCLRYAAGVVLAQTGWVAFVVALEKGLVHGPAFAVIIAFLWVCELSVPVWAERAGGTPWHAHHIAERYGLMVIIVLGECVLGATNAVAGMWQSGGWTWQLALVCFAGITLIFSLWWMYFLLPSGETLHQFRERAWVWGYGHCVLFASIAAMGAGLEVVADVLKSHAPATAHTESTAVAHGVSAFQAISMVALCEAIFVISLWVLHRTTARARNRQIAPTLICLATIALGPLCAWQGLPLWWSLLLLPLGPVAIIAYNEQGRRHCSEHFAIR